MTRRRDKSENTRINRRDVLDEVADEETKRRRVLKGVGAMFGPILGFSNRTAAVADTYSTDELKAVAQEYHSASRIHAEIETIADDLLDELAVRGDIDVPSTSALPIDNLYTSATEYGAADEGAIVFGIPRENGPTPKIEVKKRISDEKRLTLVVEPDHGEGVAFIENESPVETTKTVVRADGTSTLSECDLDSIGTYCKKYCAPDSCGCLETHRCRADPCHTHGPCSGCCVPDCSSAC